jgi:prevent-host-death family protein
MNGIVEVVPISDLRHRQNEIMDQLSKGPVILTQHGRGTAVLLSMQQWQEISECLRSMADAQALRALYAEFDIEERELAQAGARHYARLLAKEDEADA